MLRFTAQVKSLHASHSAQPIAPNERFMRLAFR
jgi:hypothetical protein